MRRNKVVGECSVCGGQNGNHYPWCGHGRQHGPITQQGKS